MSALAVALVLWIVASLPLSLYVSRRLRDLHDLYPPADSGDAVS